MFEIDPATLLATIAGGVLAYAGVVALLRVAGKRTLAKWNAFDLVVTVALGSALATVLLSGRTSLAQGLVGLALLVGLQWLVARLAMRHPAFRRLIKAEPRLLLRDGRFVERALQEERVTQDEVRAAVRAEGYGRLEDVGAVVLETDGTVSVIGRDAARGGSALAGVRGIDAATPGEPARTDQDADAASR
jgi:uncharacterized membrane protein YcaP (DUF421 family)